MLISESMNGALNQQIGNEFSASHQNVSIASHFATETLPELAAHFYAQADAERNHAMRFVEYVINAGGRVEIPSIPMPKTDFKSGEEAVQAAVDQGKDGTDQINELVDLSLKESDHLTHNFLACFLAEQLKVVSTTESLLKVTQRAGESNLLQVENHLARRGGEKALKQR